MSLKMRSKCSERSLYTYLTRFIAGTVRGKLVAEGDGREPVMRPASSLLSDKRFTCNKHSVYDLIHNHTTRNSIAVTQKCKISKRLYA